MPVSAGEALAAALALRGGAGAEVQPARSRPWASATFTGARHRIDLRLPVAQADAFVRGLAEADFALGRHLLVDVAVTACHVSDDVATIGVEALTLEEG